MQIPHFPSYVFSVVLRKLHLAFTRGYLLLGNAFVYFISTNCSICCKSVQTSICEGQDQGSVSQ